MDLKTVFLCLLLRCGGGGAGAGSAGGDAGSKGGGGDGGDGGDGGGGVIRLSQYCPRAPGCGVGEHVLCVDRPESLSAFGAACHRPSNASLAPDAAAALLRRLNAVRSAVARGGARGRAGALLPRGYGLMRVEWDNELATLAQVWANQCIFRKDTCRSTTRFPGAGQAVALWSARERPGPPSRAAARRAAALLVDYWQRFSALVAVEDLAADSWSDNQTLYLQLVAGGLTHVGCGMAAQSGPPSAETMFSDLENKVSFVVCNFSHRPRAPVYRTAPAGEAGAGCGCPPGTREDRDTCLCRAESSCANENCTPNVMLLPILADQIQETTSEPVSKSIEPNVGNTVFGFSNDQLKKNEEKSHDILKKQVTKPAENNKLLMLLDHLESEVDKINLADTERERFNAKIKKIYEEHVHKNHTSAEHTRLSYKYTTVFRDRSEPLNSTALRVRRVRPYEFESSKSRRERFTKLMNQMDSKFHSSSTNSRKLNTRKMRPVISMQQRHAQ